MLPKNNPQLLRINLSTKEIEKKEYKDKELLKKTLGGRGLATYIYINEYDQTLPPEDERSPIIYATGLLTSTMVPSSGRTSVIFKSPVTKSFFKTNVGGHFGGALKYAGYDILIVEGKSETPCYIYINDNRVEILDASDLWGMDNRKLNAKLRSKYNDEELQLACIGPAGENQVAFASIHASIYNAAARGGGGAVMGAKNLKCIAVHGNKFVEVAKPKEFYNAVARISEKMDHVPGVKGLTMYGTSIGMESTNAIGAFPVRNFQENQIDGVRTLTGQYIIESGLMKNRVGCYTCPVSCHRYCTIDDGKYKGTYTGGPEYETLASFGGGCGTTDTEVVLKANEYCNILGMDVISAGGVIQWLMECKQRGVVTDDIADGLDLSWGNGDTIVELTRKIAYREGVGDLLADGVKAAAEKIGKDSYKWAIQAKGLEQSRVETRAAFSYALAFAVNSRGPDHLNTECLAEFGGDYVAVEVIKKITGSEKYAYPHTTEKRPEIVRWHEDIYAAGDSLGICAFPTTAQFWMDESDLAELFSTATGIEITKNDIMEAGRRTILMERMCVGMMGFDRNHDKLPYRLMNEKLENAKHDNAINSHEDIEIMKDGYYKLHKWDLTSGLPTNKIIKDSNLGEFVEKYSKHVHIKEEC